MAASRIKVITIEIGGDTTKLQTALNGINTETKNTQRYLKMKGEPKSYEMALQPLPQVIVSVRDKEGRNNALAVGYTANVSHDPAITARKQGM
jgi:hypothetical protein